MVPIAAVSNRNEGNYKTSTASSDEAGCSKKYKKRCRVNGFYSSLRSTDRERKMNANKLRIRFLPEEPNEDTKRTVIKTLNLSLCTTLKPSDVISCERVVNWEGHNNPRDIIVILGDFSIRQKLLVGKYSCLRKLNFEMEEELGKERAEIFTEAILIFGEERVLIGDGRVLVSHNNYTHQISTMWEFRVFLRKISHKHTFCPHTDYCIKKSLNISCVTDDESSYLFIWPYPYEKEKPKKKIRFRKIPEVPHENTTHVVIEYISSNMHVDLETSDIKHCERVPAWNGCVDPRDIVVVFKSVLMRQQVYFNRTFISNGRSVILDEMSREMIAVWTEAADKFGEDNVYTDYGKTVIIDFEGHERSIFSMRHFQSFLDNSEIPSSFKKMSIS